MSHDKLREAVATEQAVFDGRPWQAMSRVDRERYLARADLAMIRIAEALKEPTPEMVKAVEAKDLEFGEPVDGYRVNVSAILATGLAASPLYPEMCDE